MQSVIIMNFIDWHKWVSPYSWNLFRGYRKSALRHILFVDLSPPASVLGRSLCLQSLSFSDAWSRASIGPPGIGGPRRRWSPRKELWRWHSPPPCCRDRPRNFRVSMPPHLLFVRPPPHLPPRMAVSVTGWPKFGTSCILSDVGNYKRLVIAVCPAYGDKTCPDCPSVPGSSFPCFWLVVRQPQISYPEREHIECRHSGEPVLPVRGSCRVFSSEKHCMRIWAPCTWWKWLLAATVCPDWSPSRVFCRVLWASRLLRRTYAPSRPISPRPFASRWRCCCLGCSRSQRARCRCAMAKDVLTVARSPIRH